MLQDWKSLWCICTLESNLFILFFQRRHISDKHLPGVGRNIDLNDIQLNSSVEHVHTYTLVFFDFETGGLGLWNLHFQFDL